MLNSVIVEGELVDDCSITSYSTSDFSKMTISVNQNLKNVSEVYFFDILAYGKIAQYCKNKALKGRSIRVVGRLKQQTFTDNNNQSFSKIYIVAEHIEFKVNLENKNEEPFIF